MKLHLKNFLKLVPFGAIYALLHIPLVRNMRVLAEIRPYFNRRGFTDYRATRTASAAHKAKIIVYGLRTNAACNLAVFEKVFSDAFRFNGATVKNLVCGGCLPSCDGATKGISDRIICRACNTQRPFHIRNYANDFIYFDQFIDKAEIKKIQAIVRDLNDRELESYVYLGVNVGRHAVDSVIFNFQFIFDRNNKRHLDKLRKSIVVAMMTATVASNVLKKERPTHIFTLHGCYAAWGPFAEYLSKKGVTVYVYRKVLNPGMGYFDFPRWTDDPNDVPAKEVWERVKDVALTADQKKLLRDFMETKRSGKTADYRFFYEQKKGRDDEFLRMLDSGKRRFVIYLHQLWDRGFEEATSSCFDNHLGWIKETVAHFAGLKDACLFIKPHPAEYSIFEQGKHGGADVIEKLFSSLPENVSMIGKDIPLTSYDLMEKGCIGITFYGTVGLEHSYFKKPVLVGGDIHYADIGAAYKIRSKDEYFRLLEDPSPLYDYPVKNHDLIERYAYHYYFRPNIRIPFIRDDVFFLGHCIDWDVLKNYEDFIRNNKVVNRIARLMIDNKSVVNVD
ncbi:MAG: hypothetical protein KBC23_01555 [Candidatus Omnitrophica bacterium]|nr:hypothetical protein [Candidatus Omnitrophota bacterium]